MRARSGVLRTVGLGLTLVAALLAITAVAATATPKRSAPDRAITLQNYKRITKQQRMAAAKQQAAAHLPTSRLSLRTRAAALDPTATPHYYGPYPNYANSPLPMNAGGTFATSTASVVGGTGIRKFVDSLPGLGESGANDLGQYIPVAVADKTTYSGSDYYVIALVRYGERLHSDLPTTTLQGYVQIETTSNAGVSKHFALKYPDGSPIMNGATPLYGVDKPQYMGPAIVATKDRPVRVKFMNKLPTGSDGNLFLPVDTTVMGAGMGPQGGMYTQNRATLHLHGGFTPWISDGTPHQWTTPANENTPYQEGVSVKNVPDMDGGNEPTGTLTFYYTNQQSARLMFYHDHSYGITRLNVYAGEAAPYLLQDSAEATLIAGGTIRANGSDVVVPADTIPDTEIPLVIQDKTFVPTDTQLAQEDPTWNKAAWGGIGNLWYPHVYMPNQNPDPASDGTNPMGRWDYSWWFYPPLIPVTHTPIANPYYPAEPQQTIPDMPKPTITPEAFMDTPLVNGTAYPYVKVGRRAYRFRILNASNDRYFNLQLYFAQSNTPDSSDTSGNPTLQTRSGDVTMVPAAPSSIATWPASWPKDGRDGGVPDPGESGPSWIQIGNEGGFIPSATVLPPQPVGYEYFRRTVTVLNVKEKSLYIGPAERADVIVDFSQVPNGSKLIMYNDAPAPMPGFDSRNDYFTNDGDQTMIGGAPNTLPGYGPNTRTIMQFQVGSTDASSAFSLSRLQTGLQAAYAATQAKPIVPEPAYSSVFNTSYPANVLKVADTTMTFTPADGGAAVTKTLDEKAIVEGFDTDWGRMNANLGGTLPNLGPQFGGATPYDYGEAPTDITTMTAVGAKIGDLADGTQIWRIDHQGVDTHVIHFHLVNVQVIERVAIDGQIFPTDPNELGWKESVRMSPGQDVIVAMRPTAPVLPWKLPDSVRPINPTVPLGATWTDVNGTAITNVMANFGWEYVWHCHLLDHEENDMMRPFVMLASPSAPSNLAAAASPLSTTAPRITLTWTNNWTVPAATMVTIQRATDPGFTASLKTFTAGAAATSYVDATPGLNIRYYYRVRAEDAVGYSPWTNTATVRSAGWLPLAPVIGGATSTSNSILFSWSQPAGAPVTGFYVYRAAAVGGPFTRIATVTGTSYNNTGLRSATYYYYRVQAYNAYGSSAFSTTVRLRTK